MEGGQPLGVSDQLRPIEDQIDPNVTVAKKNWIKAYSKVNEQLDRVSVLSSPTLSAPCSAEACALEWKAAVIEARVVTSLLT